VKIIWKRIRLYNKTHDQRYITGNYCGCQEEWSDKLQRESKTELQRPLIDRIINVAAQPLSLQDYIRRKILEGGKQHGYTS